MTTPGPHRRGITRNEVLLVALLLLVVLGVGLAGLRQWWERAWLLHCANNLKVMGEAVAVYHDRHGYLPAACIEPPYATWAVQIGPFMPEGSTGRLREWDMPLSYYRQPEPVRLAQVPYYYCPARRRPPQVSAPDRDAPEGVPGAGTFAGALGDYAGCAGDGSAGDNWLSAEADGAVIPGRVLEKEGDRILQWRGRVTTLGENVPADLAGLPRGQSSTILVGEKHVPYGHFGEAGYGDGPFYNGGHPASFARVGGPGHPIAPSITAPLRDNFGSYHPGVCQFLMADGRVEGFTPSVSPELLGRLANRNE